MKPQKNVTLTIEGKDALVEVFEPEAILEIRYYNVKDKIDDHTDLWIDDNGRQCIRYFVSYKSREEVSKEVLQNLQSFADDLKHHSGLEAKLEPTTFPDGLHVLNIDNRVDYYFQADHGGYDGWGKAIRR